MKRETVQRDFLAKAGPNIDILRQMAEEMPGTNFNIVDCANRVIAFNRANCENCNFKSESEIVGRTLEEAFPPVLAEAYVSLYEEVRTSGVAVRNRISTHGSDRSTAPRVANVFPIRDKAGAVIGTAAFYRPINDRDMTPDWYQAFTKAITYIDDHFAEKISIEMLSRLVNMSETSFRRNFRKFMALTVGDYITTIRLNHARKLLATTSMKIFDIAVESGFYDQSHFIHAFKRNRHLTPAQYRQKHRQSAT